MGDQLRNSAKYISKYLTQFDDLSFFCIVQITVKLLFLSSKDNNSYLKQLKIKILVTLRETLLAFNYWTGNFRSFAK